MVQGDIIWIRDGAKHLADLGNVTMTLAINSR